jgi:hypothetical protein
MMSFSIANHVNENDLHLRKSYYKLIPYYRNLIFGELYAINKQKLRAVLNRIYWSGTHRQFARSAGIHGRDVEDYSTTAKRDRKSEGQISAKRSLATRNHHT